MFQNRKFGFCTVILCLTGFVYMFLCACLEGGQLELLRGQLAGGAGWSARQIQRPAAVGAVLAVPLAYVCLEGCLRHSVRQSMIVWGAAAALGCIGLVNADGAYWLLFVSLVLVRCACTALELGVTVLCARWFIRYRGRVLGLVTMGAPVFYAVGASSVAGFIHTRLGGDARPFYLTVAVLLALMALAVRFLLRDRPEDTGLYPDGEGRAPDAESGEPEPPLSVGRLLRSGRFWLVLAVTGALAAAGAGCLGTVEARLAARAAGGTTLLRHAAPWLALGAIFAIPASYIFGWLCDKLGEVWTALPLLLAELGCAYLLWTFPKDMDASVGAPLCLAMACLMGGVSTVIPALIVRAFGRQQLLPACRALFPALLLLAALAGPVAELLGGGERAGLYAVLMAVAAAGLAALPILGRALAKDRKRS